MEAKYCKNPECKKPVIGRRADAIYCSYKCSYIVRNSESKKCRISLLESRNLIAYKKLMRFIDYGATKMSTDDFEKCQIDVDSLPKDIDHEGKLNIKLFDLYIKVDKTIVCFNTKEK